LCSSQLARHFFPNIFQLTRNDKNLEILAWKNKKHFLFQKKPSNDISKLNENFSDDFIEVLHISVGPEIIFF
jgi:hypothetical protein